MSSLILKDLLIQKKTTLLSVIYIAIMLVVFNSISDSGPLAGTAVFAAAMVGVTYVLVGNACAYEDKCKADVVLNSMPVNRAQIVAARYLSVYVFMVIGVVYYAIVAGAIRLLQLPVTVAPLSLEAFVGALFAVSLMNSIYLPTFFRWGYIKSRMVSFILFFVFFFGGNMLAESIYRNRENPLVQPVLQFIAGLPAALLGLGFVALILLMMAVSYLISVRIYKHREF